MASEPSSSSSTSKEELRAQLAAQQQLIDSLLAQQQTTNPVLRGTASLAEDSAAGTSIDDEALAIKLQMELDGGSGVVVGGRGGSGGGGGGSSRFIPEEDDDEALARRLEAGELLGGEAVGGGAGSSDADEAMARQYQRELNGASPGRAYDGSSEREQDARLAAMMQQMEMERGGEEADGEGTANGGDDFAGMRLEDPVWGTLEVPQGSKPKPLQILCFAVCPCCAGALCVRRRRGPAWLRWSCPLACAPQKAAVMGKLGRTLSAWLALAQLFFVGTSIALSGGFAPTWINPMLGASLKLSAPLVFLSFLPVVHTIHPSLRVCCLLCPHCWAFSSFVYIYIYIYFI